jgi:hypothetical protein
MKKIVIPALILMISLSARAQDETLISGRIESGGYGGPEVKFGNINGEWEVLVGGRGGWIINRQYVLGGAGYGMATKGEILRMNIPGLYEQFELGYGGLMLGYVSQSHRLVHVTVDVIIGGGGISPPQEDNFQSFNSDAFFVFEPNVNFILNVTPNLRFGFGGGYRIAAGVEYRGLEDSDISGASINLLVKIGIF